jgi:hypothetical protein
MNQLALSIGGTSFTAPGGIPGGGMGTFSSLLQTGISLGFLIAIVVFVVVLLWSGISWLTSGGDKQKLQKTRDRIWFSIVGLIIVLLSWAIISFVESTLGISGNIFTPSTPDAPCGAKLPGHAFVPC